MLWYFHRGTLISIMYSACMNSTWLEIGGVTSWYQSRLPVGNPLPTLWSKLSLAFAKLFYSQCHVAYQPTSQTISPSLILGSFSPYLYSGTLISYLFRVKRILLTLTLGSRDYFSRRAPPFYGWSTNSPEDSSIGLFDRTITFSFPLVCLTFPVLWLIWAAMIPCLCKHLGVLLCQKALLPLSMTFR